MIQFHKTPWFTRRLYPSLVWSRESSDEIFLTFDDGPHREITTWVLDELDKHEVKATFFCLGEKLQSERKMAERMLNEGHRIGNHSHTHLKGWESDTEDYVEDIQKCENEIARIGGNEDKLFRPPYGRIKKSQINRIRNNWQIIMWSHLSMDYDKNLNTQKALSKLKEAGPGSIIVFHDSEKAFKNLQLLLPPLLSHWASLGLKFSTL